MIGRVFSLIFTGYILVYLPLIICIIGAGLTQDKIKIHWWALTYLIFLYVAFAGYNYLNNKMDKEILEHHKEASK